MLHQKPAPFLRLALASTLITLALPVVSSAPVAPLMAQSAPSLAPPESVAQGTIVKLMNASSRTADISKALKQAFSAKFAGTQVISTTQPAETALQAVLDGKVDLAALSRPLTPEEKAKGLMAVPVAREKIAIVVNAANPFSSSLTLKQFADIFRGQLTDWSQIGGPAGAIRVVDRPEASDLRQSFRTYSAFNIGTLQTSGNATKLTEDSTTAMVNALGADGIGYAPISQIQKLNSVRALPLHNTLPDNAKYPFSQPHLYVFKGPSPNPAAAAFLGFALAPGSQQLANAALAGGEIAGETSGVTGTVAPPPPTKPEPTAKPAAGKLKPEGQKQPDKGKDSQTTAIVPPQMGELSAQPGQEEAEGGLLGWLWNLSPLLLLPVIWWIFKGMWRTEDKDRLGLNTLVTERSQPPHAEESLPDLDPVADARRNFDPPDTAQPSEFTATDLPTTDSAAMDWSPVTDWSAEDVTADLSTVGWPPTASASGGVRGDVRGGVSGTSGTEDPNLIHRATGTLSNLFGNTSGDTPGDISGNTSGNTFGDTMGAGAAIAAGTAAAAGMGAAAWSTFSDKQTPATDSPMDAASGLFGEPADIADLPPELPQLDYSEPAPTLDFDPLDWPMPEVALPDPATPTGLSPDGVEGYATGETLGWSPDLDARAIASSMPTDVAAGTDAWSSFLDSSSPVPGTEVTPGWNLGGDVIDPDAAGGTAGLGMFDNLSGELPEVHYENYITLSPQDAHWAYAYWSVTEDLKAVLKQQGGQTLAVRLYDVTGIDFAMTPAHSMQQLNCSDDAQDLYIPIPAVDRDYLVELGYITSDNRWLLLARSLHIHVSADGAI